MITALGGPADFCDNPQKYLPAAKIGPPCFAPTAGYVSAMATRDIGMSVIGLKGGRIHPDQKLDYATGLAASARSAAMLTNKRRWLSFTHRRKTITPGQRLI